MSRAQIRREMRVERKQENTYTFTERQLREIIVKEIEKEQKRVGDKIRAYAIRDLSAGVIEVLRHKFGFGKKRISRFFSSLNDVFVAINDGEVTIDDIIEACEKEIKFDFKLVYQESEGE